MTAENFEKTLTFTVKDYAFDIQNMYIDEEIADSTVNDANADWELYVAMKPVKALSDNKLYFTESFIQPVYGKITTEYGMNRVFLSEQPTKKMVKKISGCFVSPVALSIAAQKL